LIDILRYGARLAERDEVLITIGINPTRPEIGYGYIELGDKYDVNEGLHSYRVKEFKEKPDRVLAQQYYVGRLHMWNSGMFIWSAKSILTAIAKCKPEMHKLLMDYSDKIGTPEERAARLELFNQAEAVSIDIGVLESAHNVIVIKADLIWDDIGSWLALERITARDKDNNVTIGATLLHESYEVTAVNADGGILATLGVSDLVVVKTGSVVFVAHKARVNDIKLLLARMKDDPEYDRYL
jgi:mannose-1-phosphate guanylyltransferase